MPPASLIGRGLFLCLEVFMIQAIIRQNDFADFILEVIEDDGEFTPVITANHPEILRTFAKENGVDIIELEKNE